MTDRLAFEPAATRSWDYPRQVAGTAFLVDHGEAAGVPVEALLAGTGLSQRDVSDHQRRVTADQELRVVRNLLRCCPGLTGTQVGAGYHASTFGPMGFALLSSATLGDAANLALRYIDLSFTFTIPSATVDGDDLVIVIDDRGVPADVRRFLVERDTAAVWTVLSEVAGGAPLLTSVVLPFPVDGPRGDRTDLATFGVEPVWEPTAREATLRLAAHWLDHPLPQANPHACALAEALCRDLVSSRRSRSGIVEHVRVHVAQQLEAGAPMAGVAAALGLSERSLRRRLSEAGTSYRSVLDEVRRAAAEELLADGSLLVEEVARRLGYAESSSLGVAHRRWTGRAPRVQPTRIGHDQART